LAGASILSPRVTASAILVADSHAKVTRAKKNI
jgi:hypothetical protein